MRRTIVAGALACSMVIGGTGANAAVTSEKVIGGPGNQYWPSSSGDKVAFTEARRGHYDVFVSRSTVRGAPG